MPVPKRSKRNKKYRALIGNGHNTFEQKRKMELVHRRIQVQQEEARRIHQMKIRKRKEVRQKAV